MRINCVVPMHYYGLWAGLPHASARTGIFVDGGRVCATKTVIVKSQPPAYPFVLPQWPKGSSAAVLSNCVLRAVHLMHHTPASRKVER